MATSIPALKPDSAIVSGGRGIINEFPTLRILRLMIMAELYNVISARASSKKECRSRAQAIDTGPLSAASDPTSRSRPSNRRWGNGEAAAKAKKL